MNAPSNIAIDLPVFDDELFQAGDSLDAAPIDSLLLQLPIGGSPMPVVEGPNRELAYTVQAISSENRTLLRFDFPGGVTHSLDYSLVDVFPVPVRIRGPAGTERLLIIEGEDEGFVNVIPYRYPSD